MLFQVLCGFEPIFYTTHPNEESLVSKISRGNIEAFSIMSVIIVGVSYILNIL